MSGSFLLGVPGKLSTVLARLTAGRASNLDNLDAAVTTRASAASLTSGVAALDAAITARTSIASIQTGYVSASSNTHGAGEDVSYHDVTITAVVTAKSLVFLQPISVVGTVDPETRYMTGRLTSTTNLRVASPEATTNEAHTWKFRWVVLEFK